MKKLFIFALPIFISSCITEPSVTQCPEQSASEIGLLKRLVYPMDSRTAGEEGKVVLRALVNECGYVEKVDINRSSGYKRLDDAAITAVRSTRFRPYLENAVPVKAYAVFPIKFQLDSDPILEK
jgi:TonB family protein